MPAVIVGNGRSRAGYFEMQALPAEVPVYGCNALYRDAVVFQDRVRPDWITVIDDGMAQEVLASTYPRERVYWPEPDRRYEPAACNPSRPRMNAGMAAMDLAIHHGYTRLWCVGFDFLLYNPGESVSNLYDGTVNYGQETRAQVGDTPGRFRFLHWFASQHPAVDMTFFFPEGSDVLQLFAPNLTYKSYTDWPACLRSC